jgi:hypothetical protein
MTGARATAIVNNWNTVRYELLNTKICDLGLTIQGSPIEPFVRRVTNELEGKGFHYRPMFYLTDSWGCPNEVPAVGIPFYLADWRLARIEEEQTGEIEDGKRIIMLLRHELGHAVNYAYRLWQRPGWGDVFGRFSQPYRDTIRPDPASRDFVRHLVHSQYGRSYGQKHPDEDFAETFAVWLTPRSGWRRKYRFWPAIRKLRYIAELMRDVCHEKPLVKRGALLNPVASMTVLLAEHYGQRAERYRAAAEGYVDDKLRQVFPVGRGRGRVPAALLIRRHSGGLAGSLIHWSGLSEAEVQTILTKLESRAEALHLTVGRSQMTARLRDLSMLATALAMDFSYTGRFTG